MEKYEKNIEELCELEFPIDQKWKENQSKIGLKNPECYVNQNSGSSLYLLLKENPKSMKAIRDIYENQIVADLGAGTSECGYLLASLGGAKTYLGVEAFYGKELEENLRGNRSIDDIPIWECSFEGFNPIPYSIVKEDMLSFLKSVKDDSLSFLTSGIDLYILNNTCEVGKEVSRTMHPKGGLLSLYSDIEPENTNITYLDKCGSLGYSKAIFSKGGEIKC